jgi:type II secretory pathway component PulF
MSTETAIILVLGSIAYAPVALCVFLMLLGRRAGWLGIAASLIYTLCLAAVILVGMIVFRTGIMPILIVLMLGFGLLLYAYRRYRQGRQEEVFQIIATAVESNVPLAPALRAYVLDRPVEGRAGWDAALMLACPPGYLLWTQRRTFDDRVAHLSTLLSAGAPLPDALRIVRGVAPPEVTVAAEVGDTTGRLAVCLRKADRDRLAGAWLELMPRVLYPLMLLVFIGGVTTFMAVAIVPKFRRIFDDFHEPLPPLTDGVFRAMYVLGDFGAVIILGLMFLAGLIPILILSPSLRWRLPIIGRAFRWETQALVLRMLGALFEVGRPAPEALGLLADTPDVPTIARNRLALAQVAAQRGEPLADALRNNGLLPAAMAPLVSAAERTHTLPSVLTELGDLLAGRAVALARRLTLITTPILVVIIGVLVGFVVVGLFMPLTVLLERLAEL